MRHIAHPSFPNVPNFSFKKYDPSTAPIKTLRAPKGVTRIAGANAYAAKFAISPTITGDMISKTSTGEIEQTRTCYDTCPPYRTLQIRKSISFKAVSFFCVDKPLPMLLANVDKPDHEGVEEIAPYFFSNDKTRSCC